MNHTAVKLIRGPRVESKLGWSEAYSLAGCDNIRVALLRLRCNCPDPRCDKTRWGIAIEFPSVAAIDRGLALRVKRKLVPHVSLLECRPDHVCFCNLPPETLDRMLQLWEQPGLTMPGCN